MIGSESALPPAQQKTAEKMCVCLCLSLGLCVSVGLCVSLSSHVYVEEDGSLRIELVFKLRIQVQEVRS